MKFVTVVGLTCLFCSFPSKLMAGEGPHEIIFEPGVGLQVTDLDVPGLNKNVESLYDASVFVGAQYLWNVSQTLGIGLDVNFLGDSDATRRQISGAPTAWETKSLVVMAVLRYYVTSTSLGKPYVLCGLGAHRTTLLVDDRLVPVIDSSRWGIATALGAGWEVPVRAPFVLGIEGRWQYLTQTHYSVLGNAVGSTTATGGTAQASSLDLFLRMGIRF